MRQTDAARIEHVNEGQSSATTPGSFKTCKVDLRNKVIECLPIWLALFTSPQLPNVNLLVDSEP